MNYGFVIDNRRCIGCHACSTACKQENEVPLGVYRTWVKYVDKGAFPDARRSFQVTRCNHCANPPCVRICPVTAMYQRTDGIVEFDPEVCIGCKACLQACPYDAIYIDPDTGTAAKCHYCSHRTDIGLEPACVVVCPTQAIISGDLSDPHSPISMLVAREPVTVRKPEQGTAPKLFYIDGDAVALTPTAAQAPGTFMWADLVDERDGVRMDGGGRSGAGRPPPPGPLPQRMGEGEKASSGVAIRTPGPQGGGSWRGPIHIGDGRMAEHLVQVTYNAQHKIPWHWQVPAYLVTKAIGSGVFMLVAMYFWMGYTMGNLQLARQVAIAGSFTSLLSIGLTTLLLVLDLERPGRFLTILTRPQWKSWLTRGAFVLVGFSLVDGVWFLVEIGAMFGVVPEALANGLRPWLLVLGFPLAVLSAVYTAFLFGQAEGRDLWQSGLLPLHMLVQAMMAGAVVLSVFFAVGEYRYGIGTSSSGSVFVIGFLLVVVDLFILLFGDGLMPHATETAARAGHAIRHGKYRRRFWWGAVGLGHVLPIITVFAYITLGQVMGIGINYDGPNAWWVTWLVPLVLLVWALMIITPFAVLIGLYLYEHAFVMAPQEVPNA